MLLPRPVCIEGDLRYEFCGLTAARMDWIRSRADTMIHNAAHVEFDTRGTRLWDINVTGTQNVLDLCHAARLAQLHYISTAYICGDYDERFYEHQLDVRQGFRNEYERSKFTAEQLVRRSSIPDQTTVFRPSIIVGESTTGFASHFRGIYILAQFAHWMEQQAHKDRDGGWDLRMKLQKSSKEIRHLVPVDWVTKVVNHIVQTPSLHGQTYHITPSRPVTAQQIEAALRGCFNYRGLEFTEENDLTCLEGSASEKFFDFLAPYLPYWETEPTFDNSNTRSAMAHIDELELGTNELQRTFEYAVQAKFRRQED